MLPDYGLRWPDIIICAAAAAPLTFYAWTLVPAPAALAAGYMAFSVLAIALTDLRKFVIPDALSLPAIPLGLLAAYFADSGGWPAVQMHSLAAFAAAAALYLIRAAYRNLRGIEGLGMGDVKLAASAGA